MLPILGAILNFSLSTPEARIGSDTAVLLAHLLLSILVEREREKKKKKLDTLFEFIHKTKKNLTYVNKQTDIYEHIFKQWDFLLSYFFVS